MPRNNLMNISDHEKKEHENFINKMKGSNLEKNKIVIFGTYSQI